MDLVGTPDRVGKHPKAHELSKKSVPNGSGWFIFLVRLCCFAIGIICFLFSFFEPHLSRYIYFCFFFLSSYSLPCEACVS